MIEGVSHALRIIFQPSYACTSAQPCLDVEHKIRNISLMQSHDIGAVHEWFPSYNVFLYIFHLIIQFQFGCDGIFPIIQLALDKENTEQWSKIRITKISFNFGGDIFNCYSFCQRRSLFSFIRKR